MESERLKRAFTIVELLIVAAIVAILMSLLFPVLSQARTRARESVCASNLNQVFIAAKMYQDDNGDYPPNGSYGPLAGGMNLAKSLRCFAADGSAPWDYLLLGRPDAAMVGAEDLAKYDHCRKVRGEAFPTVTDINHATVQYGYSAGRQPNFLVRESGSFSVVDQQVYKDMVVGKSTPPCDLMLGAANL